MGTKDMFKVQCDNEGRMQIRLWKCPTYGRWS